MIGIYSKLGNISGNISRGINSLEFKNTKYRDLGLLAADLAHLLVPLYALYTERDTNRDPQRIRERHSLGFAHTFGAHRAQRETRASSSSSHSATDSAQSASARRLSPCALLSRYELLFSLLFVLFSIALLSGR